MAWNGSTASIEAPKSVFESDLPIEAKLERARTELLDISARNRLLNIPRSSKSARILEVIDENSAEVFRLLVRESRAFTFAAGRAPGGGSTPDDEAAEELSELAQPDDDSFDERGIPSRHTDTKLQTRLTSKGLQKRLLDLYFDARTLEEEQGVNILFLALGTLKWVDPANANNVRYAPLILIPVRLERSTAGERFKLRWRQEDPAPNLSLEAYLDRVHVLTLPPFEQGEDCDPAAYMQDVAGAVSSKPGWAVAPNDIVLGFFSFSKFLMYRDLDPEVWPTESKLTTQPLIRGLISTGFESDSAALIPEDAPIDGYISPAEMLHIVDCDSSQTVAVHDARRGRNVVIQGPPGTGKSQTIANIIASAIADGRTVLFVAEKMAALEVVKRRLDQTGVGDACLELHSHKSNKRLLLDELRRTWELGAPRGDSPMTLVASLRDARDELNAHVERMHRDHGTAGVSPYHVVGQLVRLRGDGRRPADLRLECPESWSAYDCEHRRGVLTELAQRIADIGRPAEHPWNGVELNSILPTDLERLTHRIADLGSRLDGMVTEHADIAAMLDCIPSESLKEFGAIADLARRVAGAPDLEGDALAADVWDIRRDELTVLVQAGFDYARLTEELENTVSLSAWATSVDDVRSQLASLPADFPPAAFEQIDLVNKLLPQLFAEADKLKADLGLEAELDTILAITRVASIGERVAAAPQASPEAFAAAVWDYGLAEAADLAEAVAALERAKTEVGNRFTDAAWTMDLGPARQALAAHEASFFRFLSGDWRRANRLTKSVLAEANIPLTSLLALLDSLARGQVARAKIRDGDSIGRAAFGNDWRGERSAAAPLRALVDWMGSLPGLGAEPRLIVSRMPDRAAIGDRAARVQHLLAEVRPLLQVVWSSLGTRADEVSSDAAGVGRAKLRSLAQKIGSWYLADRACRAIMVQVPAQLADRLACLEQLSAGQTVARTIAAAEELGKTAFGTAWAGIESDWPKLAAAADWLDANHDIRAVAARLTERRTPAQRAIGAMRDLIAFVAETEDLLSALQAGCTRLFGVAKIAEVPTTAILACFHRWLAHTEQLSKWVAYRERAQRARALGVGEIIDWLEDGRLEPADTLAAFDMAYYERLFADQIIAEPALARFDGQLYGRLVQEFTERDRQRIAAARLEVVRAHHRRIPQAGGGIGPLGVLRAEMARRRGHMPIRQLMQKAAPAVQALKPVFMMSPLSVAQFLPPGQLTFDLLVMDEASQIQPVDALGAIARCRQVVVVGDERQLPPTKFFAKMTGSEPEDDDLAGAQVADMESILGLFTARGLPQRMLRWHYRSRHQSLIAVSNSQFYENKLFIVPSPYTQEAGMGLRFNLVPDGVFDSGNTGTNVIEAKKVAEAIIQHAKLNPELSLGVAAFSVKQRRAIQDQLELLRRLNPDTEPFFHAHPGEPFFVKNLENVQGDERDVIFISVGYGHNQHGRMVMQFGPLSAEGGERRLNVLISRAKRRCEVFASITDEDIDLERGKGKGVFAFKLFLHFARTGRLGPAPSAEGGSDDAFELQVARALQARNYQVHPKVGIAGFFIDLAIADAERPGRYLLGIECDGASYRAARSARDRDRLRQAVLEDHGWIMHRIWSIDWFQRPREQIERTIAAIEAAKEELDARLEKGENRQRAVPIEVVTIERSEVSEVRLAEVSASVTWSTPYREASPSRPSGTFELHEAPTGVLAGLVHDVVQVEGPVHVDEVVARVRAAWGLQRAGGRIQSAVERGISFAVEAGRVELDDRFLSIPRTETGVRDRSGVASAALRRPELLPPAEIRAAILATVKASLGATSDEIVQTVARSLGYKSTSAQLRETIQTQIDRLTNDADLIRQGDVLVTASP